MHTPVNITGPMFSGKTSYLISLLEKETIADNKCLVIKYENDLRFGLNKTDNVLMTHSRIRYDKSDVKYTHVLNESLYLYIITGKYQVVAVEEGQFFENLMVFIDILMNSGVKVYITSLNGDYLQRPFPQIAQLNSKAEVIQLRAICLECKNDQGVYTVRTVKSQDVILIGGKESYKTVCCKCVYKYNSINNKIVHAYQEMRQHVNCLDDWNDAYTIIKKIDTIKIIVDIHPKVSNLFVTIKLYSLII